MKNVYAIICGCAHGLGFGANTRAELITLALKEYALIAKAMNFPYNTLALPGIVGDLVLTCSSPQSRNYTFGFNSATMLPREALLKSGKTIEGYHTSFTIHELSKKCRVQLRLAHVAHTIAEKGKEADKDFKKFVEEV